MRLHGYKFRIMPCMEKARTVRGSWSLPVSLAPAPLGADPPIAVRGALPVSAVRRP
jgi:hypothetical protein